MVNDDLFMILNIHFFKNFYYTKFNNFKFIWFSWSSKTCFQCKGPTDADWLECNRDYMLDSSGSWLPDIRFSLNTNSSFYTIWGIIAMTAAIVQIILALRYGKDVLELVMHFQTFIMLSLSLDSISDARLAYLSWIQIFKFDFGFINPHQDKLNMLD